MSYGSLPAMTPEWERDAADMGAAEERRLRRVRITGRPAFVDPKRLTAALRAGSDGVSIRLDDAASPEFWLELDLPMVAELAEAADALLDMLGPLHWAADRLRDALRRLYGEPYTESPR